MSFYPLIILTVLSTFSLSVNSDDNITRTLQVFGGTLTKLTCSAIQPAFRLTVKQDTTVTVVYGPEQYSQLPHLLNIEAKVSPTRDNVTLFINGTNRSNNVTIQCRNITDPILGRFEVLFTLVLEFISTLSAPNDIYYDEDPDGYRQIRWGPPTLVSDEPGSQNVSVDSRISHFLIYITTNESTAVYNVSGTSFVIENGIPCSFWFQVAAVNPAGVGERSPSLTFDSHTECMDSTHLTTIITTIPASSGLSAGGISAIIIVAVLIIAALLVTLVIIILAKLKNDRHQNVIQNLKSELSYEISDPNDTPRNEKEKDMDKGHSSNDNDGNKDVIEWHASTQRRTSYSQEGPPAGLYYAEIDVITKRKNQIPEANPVKDPSCHEYAVLEKPNQITEADTDRDCDDNPVDN